MTKAGINRPMGAKVSVGTCERIRSVLCHNWNPTCAHALRGNGYDACMGVEVNIEDAALKLHPLREGKSRPFAADCPLAKVAFNPDFSEGHGAMELRYDRGIRAHEVAQALWDRIQKTSGELSPSRTTSE